MNVCGKYRPFEAVPMKKREWPAKTITKAPVWCSVDLRDGNQALINPMGIEHKLEFFDLLVRLGFKQIEVGFPAASDTEYKFVRRLIEEKRIPDDVTIQVLTQARGNLIGKTVESIRGAKNVILHIYNATSPAQRKYNFGKTKEEIVQLAVDGVKELKKYLPRLCGDGADGGPEVADGASHGSGGASDCAAETCGTRVTLEYSPENFSQTEIDFSLEICKAVCQAWGASPENKVILNLPTTVESSLPNQFADQIEYFCSHFEMRDSVIISLHNHNDRGESVAQCELGLLAGAERVEGCLFGNGERTGNLDIVTVALNMFTQGVDPELDFSDLEYVAEEYRRFTGMSIHPRSPYAGELVFTAFSGSHQDAIRKAILAREALRGGNVGTGSTEAVGAAKSDGGAVLDKTAAGNRRLEEPLWDIPYLPIDPRDIGREFADIIRINSQSGKGGAVYILEKDFGIVPPKAMHPIIGEVVKRAADTLQRELKPAEIYDIFEEKWIRTKSPLNIIEITEKHIEGERGSDLPEQVAAMATITWEGREYAVAAKGNGPLDAFVMSMKQTPAPKFNISSFHEHSVGTGSDTQALAYVQITKEDGSQVWGVGKSSNVGRAGIAAVVSAINFVE